MQFLFEEAETAFAQLGPAERTRVCSWGNV
jgi:hypothetical protein